MSLTSQLDDPSSSVRDFIQHACPLPYFRHWARPRGVAYQTVFGRHYTIAPFERIAWGTVGSALNYRIGLYFGTLNLENSLAHRGAQALCSRDSAGSAHSDTSSRVLRPAFVRAFFKAVDGEIQRLSPVGKRLEGPDERLLARYCFILAMFEAVGRGADPPNAFLLMGPRATVQDLLDIPYQDEVMDLWKLSWAFHEVSKHLFVEPATFNPTFAGSCDVGGADADLLVGDCLVEVKAAVSGQVERSWLWQLLGYVLLDYEDKYQIRRVAIYLARQAIWLTWPLTKLLPQLAVSSRPSEVLAKRPLLEEMLAAETPDAGDLGVPPDIAKLAALRSSFRETCKTTDKGRRDVSLRVPSGARTAV